MADEPEPSPAEQERLKSTHDAAAQSFAPH
jgi:hypothetical protein